MDDVNDSGQAPVITDIFPLTRESVFSAFELIYEPFERGEREHMAPIVEVFRTENSAIYKYCNDMVDIAFSFTGGRFDMVERFMVGALTSYWALRNEARARGGRLPAVTEAIVHTTQADFVDMEHNRGWVEDVDFKSFLQVARTEQTRIQERYEAFLQNEPAFAEAFEKYLPSEERKKLTFKRGAFDVYFILRTAREMEKIRSLFEMGDKGEDESRED